MAAGGCHRITTRSSATPTSGCAPRAASHSSPIAVDFADLVPAVFAGWYAGADPWTSCYGRDVELAPDATRFDASPAWQAFVGAEPALELFASIEPAALHEHATGLARSFSAGMGLEPAPRQSAIVTWADSGGADLARLAGAGITASGRAGRARVAFHVFNDEHDVRSALTALGR